MDGEYAASIACPLTPRGTYVRCLNYRFTITEHDATRPWIVVGSEHRTITLEEAENFYRRAREQWPGPRWTVELDPQLSAWPQER
jgi:hypothetical protein